MDSIIDMPLRYILLAVFSTSFCWAAPQHWPEKDLMPAITEVFNVNPNSWNQPQDINSNDDIYKNRTLALFGEFSTASPNDMPVHNPNNSCVCVPYYQCKPDGTIDKHGTNLADLRERFCQDIDPLFRCCKPPDMVPINVIKPLLKSPSEQRKCGQRNIKGVGTRIVDFQYNEAQFGEFSWMVAIYANEFNSHKNETINMYQCGGALIHPQIVLSVAHCVGHFKSEPFKLTIRAGEWDTKVTNEILPHQDRKGRDIFIHEDFRAGTVMNDYALIILDNPVDFSYENVGSICLPEATDNFDNSRCFACGWGRTSYGKEGRYHTILKKIELPVVPHNQCQTAYRKTRMGIYYELDQSFMCAGGESGKDTCQGDGGSALVCPMKSNPDLYVAAGLVSWGIGCGEGQLPGVYADVPYARNWIDDKVTQAGFDVNEYQVK